MYDDDDEWQGRSWQPSTHAATPASASAPPPTKPQVNVKAAPAAAKFQAYVPHQACDFEKFSSAELQEWIECNDSTEIANIISDLIDEVVGLRSRLQYRLNLDSRDRCNSSNFP